MTRRFLLALSLAIALASSNATPASRDLAASPIPPATDQPHGRFQAIQIFIDPHDHPLAAYQFEFFATAGDVQLVGIEGGEHPAFAEPPYYDPKALASNRVIIAAFSTSSALPTGSTRVATLMIRITGDAKPTYSLHLQAAASADAQPLHADISLTGALQ